MSPGTRQSFRRLTWLIFIPINLLVALWGRSASRPADLSNYLPTANETGEWAADGPPQEFKGEDLYLYIDGGAEIYREYGFSRVLVQDYRNPAGKSLSLEIFQMTSPASAYGMYTFKKSSRGTPIAIGSEGQLEDYYLNFWKGDYLVTLTGRDQDSVTRQGVVRLAGAVAGKIPDGSEPPQLTADLPRTGLIKTSVRYFRGYLGFMNFYTSMGKEELRFEEGVSGEYSSGATLFILRYPSEELLRLSFPAIEQALRKTPKAKDFRPLGRLSFRLTDDRGKLVSFQAAREMLLIRIENPPGGPGP
jgi:hypothetical protein